MMPPPPPEAPTDPMVPVPGTIPGEPTPDFPEEPNPLDPELDPPVPGPVK